MKKIISLLLAAVLVATGMIFPANAVTGGAAASETAAVAGQPADIYVSIFGCADVESLAISFGNVPDGLSLEAVQWELSGGLMQDVDMDRKRAVWACGSSVDLTADTQVLKLTYLVGALTPGQDLTKRIPLTVTVDTTSGGEVTYEVSGVLTLSAPAAYVTLSSTELMLDLNGAKTETLVATIVPAGSTDTLSWESDNEAVATVDANGVVSAVGLGVAMITAKAGDASAVCRVNVTCSHTGGTATCTDKAICGICSNQYGSVDATNHTKEAKWIQHSDGHSKVYQCCGAEQVGKQPHQWKDTACEICGATCNHTGGTATCEAPAVCVNCGQPYGQTDPANHTQLAQWTQTAQTHMQSYGCCGAVVVDLAEHDWKNGVCAVCGYGCAHTGGTATCRQAAVCVKCGVSYGGYDRNNHAGSAVWILTAQTHGLSYGCCGSVVIAPQPHTMENGICTGCGFTCDHSGETVIQNAAAENCYRDGYTGDTYCKHCGALVQAGSTIPANGKHTSTSGWLSDGENHWRVCDTEGCEAKLEQAQHSFQWKVDQEPTYEAAGLKHEQCEVCQFAKEAEQIPALTHTHENITAYQAVPANCIQTGIVAHWTCGSEACQGKYFADEKCLIQLDTIVAPVDSGNHVELSGQSGAKGHWQTCRCGYKSEVAEHNGVVTGAVEATYESDGYTGDTICSVCGYEMAKGQVIPALEEDLDSPDTGYIDLTWLMWAMGVAMAAAVVYSKKRLF